MYSSLKSPFHQQYILEKLNPKILTLKNNLQLCEVTFLTYSNVQKLDSISPTAKGADCLSNLVMANFLDELSLAAAAAGILNSSKKS